MFFDILIPIFFWFFLIHERLQRETKHFEEETFKPENLEERWNTIIELIMKRHKILQLYDGPVKQNVFAPQAILAYAPFDFIDFETILTAALTSLGGALQLKGFTNCPLLESKMFTENYFAGVCFHDVASFDYTSDTQMEYTFDNDEPLNNLNYSILMPSELRNYGNSEKIVGSSWTTNTPFMSLFNYTDYLEEGFVPLQAAIEKAFIEYRLTASGNSAIVPKLTLQPFPNVEHYEDMLIDERCTEICSLLAFCFLFPIMRLAWRITREKEKVLIRYTYVLGLKYWLHYSAWFLHGLFIFFSNTIVTTLILKLTWSEKYPAVMDRSSFLALLIFFFGYCIVAIAHCILIASFFSDAFIASAVAGSLWILSAIPLLSYDYRTPYTTNTWIWIALFPNITLGYALGAFFWDELSGSGLQNDEIFSTVFPYVHINAGKAMAIFFAQSAAYIIVALIREKYEANCFYRWHKLARYLMASSRRRAEVSPRLKAYAAEETKVFEVSKGNRVKVAAIVGATKSYGQQEVVKDVTLNLYENNVTVLLGHNGSGKKTLLNMIVGVVRLSNGTISINGHDCLKNEAARYTLGACLHDHLLFDYLTVEDQIKFHSRLKGMTWKQAKLQADKYCQAMNLSEIRRVLTNDLTMGLRYQLAVCCAFAGKSKLVILDEPNYGMDLLASRKMLELLAVETKHRAILLSTNDTYFADVIADRVAILSRGQLRCIGNIAFLKDIYTYGGRLIIIKGPDCEVKEISAFLQQYIPRVIPESNIGKSITYLISNNYTILIGPMLDHLERDRKILNIQTYVFENISVNDVLLAMGTNYANDYDPKRQSRIPNGETPYPSAAVEAFQTKYLKIKNCRQIYGYLTFLRVIAYARYKWVALGNILIPAIYLLILYCIYFNLHLRKPLQPVYFHPTSYERSTTIIGRNGNLSKNMQAVFDNMKQWIFWLGRLHKVDDIGTKPLLNYLKELPESLAPKLQREFLVALIFANDSIAVHYSTRSYNIVPMALNMANNALAMTLIDKRASISVQFAPLEYHVPNYVFEMVTEYRTSGSSVIAIFFAFLFSWNMCIYYLALERSSKFVLMLRTTGISVQSFWMCTLSFDVTLGAIGIVFAFLATFALKSAIIRYDYAVIAFITFLAGCIVLHSVHYLFILLWNDPMTCYFAVLFYDCLGIAVFMFREFYTEFSLLNLPEFLILLVHPFVPLGFILNIIVYVVFQKQYCQNEHIVVIAEALKDGIESCEIDELSLDNIGDDIGALLVFTCVSWVLIFLIEYNRKWLLFGIWSIPEDNEKCAWEDYRNTRTLAEPDDVAWTQMKVNVLTPTEKHTAPLVVDRLGKSFGINDAVHRISFALDHNTVSGILGSNASGKSVLIQILSMLKRPSYGRVHVNGVDAVHDPFAVYNHISFCPKNMDFIKFFSACEIMEIYANIKGIPHENVATHCENIAKSLGFYEFYDNVLNVCSLGIRKRVGCALAMIGHPDLILLDEPTSGVGAYGQLLLHNALVRLCQSGSTVLFTSNSPAECQQFCDKVFVLVKGRLIVGGTIPHILETNVYGYELQIRMKPAMKITKYKKDEEVHQDDYNFDHHGNSNSKAIIKVITMVQSLFEDSVLKSDDGNLLSFVVPHHHGVANIYSTLTRREFGSLIDSFGIYHSSLHTVYFEILDQLVYEGKARARLEVDNEI